MRRKLNAMPAVFKDKSVLLVDDSIVRGTTMSQIVDMVRRAGAKKVGTAGSLCRTRCPRSLFAAALFCLTRNVWRCACRHRARRLVSNARH